MKLYQEFAGTIKALNNCEQSNNLEWYNKHSEKLDNMVDNHLPHGSGIDAKNEIDFDNCNNNKLVFKSSFHVMNDNGSYDGWIDFKIIVKPDLQFGFTLDVIGKFGKHQDLKDYLSETFHQALNNEYHN
jgi:hypothetical protein